ncbi:MAG: biotin--[acetyl-CoA-carboxylase] ligase [Alphaproteobacteria bacterium]|nr:biotin--[acetyl-CoA-carboxylase] ligase [Alphaproteobacteria bacterium]
MSSVFQKLTNVTMPAGYELRALPVVGSTNDVAKELIGEIENGDLREDTHYVIVAEMQTGGRGRTGRSWSSPAGNLYCSILIPDIGDLAQAAQLSFVTAIAMRNAIASLIGLSDVKCKWPNDIMINGQKTCGILLECGTNRKKRNWLIVGTGANVAWHPEDTPYKTTHLTQFNTQIDYVDLLENYLSEFKAKYSEWRDFGFERCRSEWLSHGFAIGERIVARLSEARQEEGVFLDLDKSGALILEKADKSRMTITAGDVFLRG